MVYLPRCTSKWGNPNNGPKARIGCGNLNFISYLISRACLQRIDLKWALLGPSLPSCLFWLKPQNLTYEISFSRRDDLIVSGSEVIEIKDPNTLLLVCLFVCLFVVYPCVLNFHRPSEKGMSINTKYFGKFLCTECNRSVQSSSLFYP